MKKFFRTTVSLIMCAMFILNILPTAAAVGDVTGYTRYTDINAYINHYIIVSYNIDGYTVVEAENLANYGFSVVWSETDRTLKIDRNRTTNDITQKYIPYETKPSLVGVASYQVLETDIKTYVNGVEAPSYNVGGKTMVSFDSLSPYGEIVWDDETRTLKLWINDGLEMNSIMQAPASLPKVTLYATDGRTINVYEDEVNSYLNVGWYSSKEEANKINNDAKKAVKNKEAVSKFYIGQKVSQWAFGFTVYGTVEDIDVNNGKVKVYWTYGEDNNGKELDYVTGTLYAGLNKSIWESASTLRPLN